MSNDLHNQNNTEEVDLGQLFKAIGTMFKSLFDFVASMLYSLFLAFVWSVFFLKRNILILGAAAVIGFIYGYVKTNFNEPTYESTALIKQNYPTGENLYSALEYFNDLISEEDSISLGAALNIESSEAGKIKGFGISTDFNDNDKLVLYDEYLTVIDTSLSDAIDFKTYIKNLADHEYEFQKIHIRFTERGLFEKTLNNLVQTIHSSSYFKQLQKRDIAELERRRELINESLKKSDSLQKVYQKVLQEYPDLSENQTSITIENENRKESTTKEYQLYLNDIQLRRELVRIEREKDDLQNIIDVITINQNSGIRYNKKSFLGIELGLKIYYLSLFLLIALIILLGIAFIKYLERYKDKI